MTAGKRILEMRTASSMTQTTLSKKTNIKREYLSKMENDHLTNPRLTTVKKLAKAFDLTISEFLVGVE